MVTFAWACEDLGSVISGTTLQTPTLHLVLFAACLAKVVLKNSPQALPRPLPAQEAPRSLVRLPFSHPLSFPTSLLHPNSSFRPAQRSPAPGLSHPTPASSSGALPPDSLTICVAPWLSLRLLSYNTQSCSSLNTTSFPTPTDTKPSALHRPLELTSGL